MSTGSSSRAALDLESYLRSHGGRSSDEDDDDEEIEITGFRHRTVDEILGDSDSSSSSEGGRSHHIAGNPDVSDDAATTVGSSRRANNLSLGDVSAVSMISDSKGSLNYSRSQKGTRGAFPLSSSLSLSSLFGGLLTNPRPGAALAVAAAASRSVQTHAATIKTRRATVDSPEKIVLSSDLTEDVSTDGFGISEDLQEKDPNSESRLVGGSSSEPLSVENISFHSFPLSSSSSSAASSESSREIIISRDEKANEDDIEIPSDLLNSDLLTSISPSGTEIIQGESKSSHTSLAADGEQQSGEQHPSPDANEVISQEISVSGLPKEAKIHLDEGANLMEKATHPGLSERASSRADKKLRSSMKPLEWAEESEKRQASSGLQWEEGAVAQPMRLKGIKRDPPAVGYLLTNSENAITRAFSSQIFASDHGSPTVLAVHFNYIAVGTSKGLVLVIPSKYSSQFEDNMDGKITLLGSSGDRPHVSVTSMCFNPQGDLLLVGYADGHLTVWDVVKASYLKIISGEHLAPIVHVLFLGQDIQVTRQFKVVTGDSKGLVLLHTFSGVRLLNFFSVKTQCLLDGQKTGTVLSACPLHTHETYFSQLSSQGNLAPSGGEAGWKLFNEGMLGEEGVVIFGTHQYALVVRLSPHLEVYQRLSRPEGTREGSLPYTAWKSSPYTGDTPSEQLSSSVADRVSWLSIAWDRKVEVFNLIKTKVTKHSSWDLDTEVVGVQWLDDEMLVLVTSRGYLGLYRKDGEELHRTRFMSDATGIDDGITYHTFFTNSFGNPEKAYHNSVSVRGATVYILNRNRLVVSRLFPWKERIQTLQRAGDWMGALDLATRLYDGQVLGVVDLPKSVGTIREVMMPFLVEMIISYVDEVFSYILVASGYPVDSSNQEDNSSLVKSSSSQEAEDQFSSVAGVAVEFCVHIKRLDILFDDIFSRFVSVDHGGTFLEILEPYILKDMLGCLPPEVMQALVVHYSSKGWVLRVEKCVLHMDISSLDFNQVIRLCREHGLYSALIYLFNRGLDDYRTPLEDLLAVIQNDESTDAALQYRVLIYLKYCFQGLAFPPGHGKFPPNRLPSVKKELLEFLLEDSTASTLKVEKLKSSYQSCPNLCYLLSLDTESSLEVLKFAFMEQSSDLSKEDQSNMSEITDSINLLLQRVINFLIIILNEEFEKMKTSQGDKHGITESWPIKRDINNIVDFITYFTAAKRVVVSGSVMRYILEFLTLDVNLPSETEKKVLSLLKVATQIDWDTSTLLDQSSKAQFFQVCGLVHAMKGNYLSALDNYMKDVNESSMAFVFIHDMMSKLKTSELSEFRSGVKLRIPQLVKLSRQDSFILVLDRFSKESQRIFSDLGPYPESLFLFLKTIIDVHLHGTLNVPILKDHHGALREERNNSELGKYLSRVSDLASLLRQNPFYVDDKIVELYIELMCQYEPKSVLQFLETFDNYRLEHCLRVCQEHSVNDAVAYLLERAGDVGGALEFLMNGLDEKITILSTAVEAICTTDSQSLSYVDLINTCLNMGEVASLRDILHMAIGLCQRNTKRLHLRESEALWFRLLDLYCEPLRGPYGNELSSPSSGNSCRGRGILRGIFSYFVKDIVEKMVGYLPLLSVMNKMLADNGSLEFGDFKLALLELLGTYTYERRILGTAKSLIEDDTFYTMDLLRRGASHAYALQSLVCCLCDGSVAKISSSSLSSSSTSSSIRLYSCGHATHLYCEPQERDTLNGCPICVPKRKPHHLLEKSVLMESSLISNPRAHRGKTIYHLHEPEASEKAHGTSISRFEFLNTLQGSGSAIQADSMPPLRLAPPSMYHEKVHKEDSREPLRSQELSKSKSSQSRNSRPTGFSKRLPLKSTIFGKEKIISR